jgi:sugar/nucleoside kinase (ribokinase family)
VAIHYLRRDAGSACHGLIGVGGIGSGLFFALEGDRTLGRNESRPARLLDSHDYCKLHIVAYYVAVLMGTPQGSGFHILPAGRVGDDPRGLELLKEMASAGMDTRAVELARGRPTTLSICFQYPDGSGGNITASDSASPALTPEDVDRAAIWMLPPTSGYIALAVPEVPLESRFHLLHRARDWSSFSVANFTPSEMEAALASDVLRCVDLLAINQDELEALVGNAVDPEMPEAGLDRCAQILSGMQPEMRIVVTMGAHGAYGFEGGLWRHCPALPIAPVSTAGAGDALLGAVISALCVGAPLIVGGQPRRSFANAPVESALDFGVLLAGYKITSRHTIHPDANLASLLDFARTQGASLGGALAEAAGLSALAIPESATSGNRPYSDSG